MTAQRQRSVDAADLIRVVSKRKWLVIIPWIIVSLIVIAGSFLLPRKYQSFALISTDPNIQLSAELRGLVGMQTDNRERSNSSKADELRGIFNEITSTYYVRQLGDRLGLLNDPALIAKAQKLAASQSGLRTEDVELDLFQQKLQDQVTVSFAASDQIKLNIESTSPTEARDIATTLGDIFVTERKKKEIASVRSSQDWTDGRLQQYQTQLEQKTQERNDLQARMLRNQQDQSIISDANRRDISSEVDRTVEDINDMEKDVKSVLGRLQGRVTVPLDKLSLAESDDNQKSKADLQEQLQSLGDLTTKYAWNDPQILNTKLRHDALLKRIALENKRLVASQFSSYDDSTRILLSSLFNDRLNLDYAYSKKASLVTALDQLKIKLRQLPDDQSSLDKINREIASITDLRDRFRRQQESSTNSQSLLGDESVSKYKVIEPAKLPLEPFSPNRKKIIAMGILMGLVIGGAAVLLMELLDKSFKRVEDVEEYLGLPVLGVAPHIEYVKQVVK
jgi:polysaccharide biosynthesis transport protein